MTKQSWPGVCVVAGGIVLSGLFLGTAGAADPTHLQVLINTRSCVNCDLSGANLAGFTLTNSHLGGSDFSGASLYKANLTQADLTGANLQDADLSGANLMAARGADLAGATTNADTTCPNAKKGPCQ